MIVAHYHIGTELAHLAELEDASAELTKVPQLLDCTSCYWISEEGLHKAAQTCGGHPGTLAGIAALRIRCTVDSNS